MTESMTSDPPKGESLSDLRRRNARSVWQRMIEVEVVEAPAAPVIAAPKPAPKPEVPKVTRSRKTKTEEVPMTEAEAQRLSEITDDAITAYNSILAQPNGVLSKVSRVGIERRRGDVRRVARVASRICQELYGEKRVSMKFWEQYFNEVDKDPFKAGRERPKNETHRNWQPNFEYLTREGVMLEVFEKAVS